VNGRQVNLCTPIRALTNMVFSVIAAIVARGFTPRVGTSGPYPLDCRSNPISSPGVQRAHAVNTPHTARLLAGTIAANKVRFVLMCRKLGNHIHFTRTTMLDSTAAQFG